MNAHNFSEFEPVPYLLEKAEKTDIPLIYLNRKPKINPLLPTVFILIGPSGSGKDTVSDVLYLDETIIRATTATSRARRIEEGEPAERHIWMRSQKDTETTDEYDRNLVQEYQLVEYDRHFGNLYGLPLSSLETAMMKGIPLIRNEPRGAKTICKFMKDKANCIVVFIIPESFEQVWQRAEGRVNFEERKLKSIEEVKEAPEVSHYYLFNPIEYNNRPGLPQAQEALRKLIKQYE
jgi:guanylate kinase